MDFKKNIKKIITSILAVFIAIFAYLSDKDVIPGFNNEDSESTETTNTENTPKTITNYKDGVTIYYIDVGQADSTLIVSEFGNMLIDGGENETENSLVKFISEKGINTLDYVVATHAHSDHIGGLDKVIEEFNVKNILMTNGINETTSYENFLKAIKKKKITPQLVKSNDTFEMGDLLFTVLNPLYDRYENLNNYSICLKMVYKDTSFLFMGDAEKEVEKNILSLGIDVLADVYKAGHHGSSTSTTEAFLNKANPLAAIISCGKNNDYGHPHKETIDKFNRKSIKTYRTDLLGTITLNSDGEHITINGETIETRHELLNKEYVDENGNALIKGNINAKGEKIYHMPGGNHYEKTVAEEYFKTEQEALNEGFKKSGS